MTAATSSPSRPAVNFETRLVMLTWLAVAVGAGLRLFGLGVQSLWFDEGYTAWMISHPFAQIVRLVRADTSPPLFYFVLRIWSLLFGNSELALRSLSALCAVATLILIVKLARRMLPSPAAVALVAWLAALSFILIQYAQEARCYALLALVCLAGLYFLIRHLESGGWTWLAATALCLAAALYIHNIAAVYVLALALAWLALPSTHSLLRRIRDGAVAAAIVAAIYGPWAAVVLLGQIRMVHQGFWLLPPGPYDITKALSGLCGTRYFWNPWDEIAWHIPYWMHMRWLFWGLYRGAEGISVAMLAASIITSALALHGRHRRNALGLAIYGLFPPLAIAIYSCWSTPLLMDKVFLTSATIMPLLLLLPSAAEQGSRPWKIGLGLGCGGIILVAWSLVGYKTESAKEDWRGAAKVVSQLPPLQPPARRLIFFVANDGQLPFDYYYPKRPGEDMSGAPAGFFDRDPPRTMLRVLRQGDLDKLQATLAGGQYSQIVLVLSHTNWADPESRTQALIDRYYDPRERMDLHDVKVFVYAKPQMILIWPATSSRP